ncbi:glycosyltransferase, partial [PVC group bacterium]|nr:glycosyltransferase [PVC group bacterium]
MDISAILINHNTREMALNCLTALADVLETLPLDHEIIVVDNNSSDGSQEAFQSAWGSRIELIENRVNRGFSQAVNQGLRKSIGTMILLINSDVILNDEALKAMVAYIKAHPDCGMVSIQLLDEDGKKQNSYDVYPRLRTEVLGKPLTRYLTRCFGAHRSPKDEVMMVESLVGACFLVSREALGVVGPMDERYYFFMEETEWCYRMNRQGFHIAFLPQVNVIHKQGQTASQYWYEARVEYHISKYLFFDQVYGWVLRVCSQGLSAFRCGINFLFNVVLGVFVSQNRKRAGLYGHLLMWHVCGCPGTWGLRMNEAKKVEKCDGSSSGKNTVWVRQHIPEDVKNEITRITKMIDQPRAETEYFSLLKESSVRKIWRFPAGGASGFVIKKHIPKGAGKWLRQWFSSSQAKREYQAAWHLQSLGIPTVTPLAYGTSTHQGIRKESFIIFEEIKNLGVLSVIYEDFQKNGCSFPKDDLKCLAEITAKMHTRNIYHADFHIGNIGVVDHRTSKQFIIMDLQRIKFKGHLSKRNRKRDLAYFVSRFLKNDALAFIKAYNSFCPDPKDIVFDDIWRLKQNIGNKKRKRRLAQALYPKGSCVVREHGYKIILAGRNFQNLIKNESIWPAKVKANPENRVIKKSRTSQVYYGNFGNIGTCYYKIDNSRGVYDFIKNIFRPSRALRAWRALARLKLLGFRVPQAVLCAEKRNLIFWRESFLITKSVSG